MRLSIATCMLALVLPFLSAAQLQKPAPALEIFEWLQGEPVQTFKPGQWYVLDFASVSCPPCRKSIPHLAALSQQFQQVMFINIYSSEYRNPDDTRYVDRTRNLFATLKDKMPFAVAIDNKARATMNKYDPSGWPSIFIIDTKGNISWQGRDVNELTAALQSRLDGSLNANAERIRQQKYESVIKKITQLKMARQYDEATIYLDSLHHDYPEKVGAIQVTRFNLWIGYNDSIAYDILREMLVHKEDVAWKSIISPAWTMAQNIDYDLVLQAADKALEEESIPEFKAAILNEKAQILRRRAMQPSDASRLVYMQQACAWREEAIQLSPDRPDTNKWDQPIGHYKYLLSVLQNKPDISVLLSEGDEDVLYWIVISQNVVQLNHPQASQQLIEILRLMLAEARTTNNNQQVAHLASQIMEHYFVTGQQKECVDLANQMVLYFQNLKDEKNAQRFSKFN